MIGSFEMSYVRERGNPSLEKSMQQLTGLYMNIYLSMGYRPDIRLEFKLLELCFSIKMYVL